MNAAAGLWAKADAENRELRKMLLLDDGTVEEYTERADPLTALAYQKQLAEEWRDRCHNAEAWCDKLESERDEWKAKAESALHENPYVGLVRGKQWERTEISDYYCGRCGWKVTDHDSYCPECGGALHKASNKPDSKFDAPKTAESGEIRASKDDIRDFGDSREKLEADCTAAWKSVERIVRSGGMPKERWTNSEFFKLLDHQAAITERECRQREYAEGDVYRKVYTKSHIDEMIHDAKIELELQRERNTELQAALDQQRAATANANDLWGRTRDELASVKAERETYRSKFGKSLDLADEIRALGADCDTGVAR